MAKIDLETLASGYQSTANLNTNFQAIEDEFNNNVLYRNPPSGEPNQMLANIDINNYKVINARDGVDNSDYATVRQLNALIGTTASGVVVRQIETKLGSQVDGSDKFTLGSVTYTPGANNLDVYEEGQRLRKDVDYTETSSSEVTLTYTPLAGANFDFITNTTTTSTILDSSAITYTPAGTGAVDTTVQGKLRESVSVKDFGAVGDGVTDDTTAIQAALDYSNTVGTGEITTIIIPDGVFLTSSLTIYSHTRIVIYGTILKKAANVYLITNNDYADAGTDEHIYIEGSGTIDCNWDAHTTLNGGTVANPLLEGIRFAGLQYSHVKGIFFEGLASTGIMLKYGGGCSDYRIEGCSFYRAGDSTNTGNALFLKGYNGVANGNTFRDIYDTPIGWERLSLGATCGNVMTNCGNGIGVTLNSADVTISGNVIEGCSAHGIVVDILSGAGGTYTSRVTITGNTILNSGEDGSGNGILIDGADNCTVIGNVIDNAGTHGVSVANADNVIISGNTVTNAATQGITCATGSFTVVNNIIFDNNPSDTGTSFGIRVDTATDLVVTSNQIYDTNTGAPKQRGIYIGSGVGTAITMANNLHDLAGTALTNLATTALDTGYVSDASKYLGTFQAADVGAGPTTDDIRDALRASGLMA